jgi:putative copper resistance protein D
VQLSEHFTLPRNESKLLKTFQRSSLLLLAIVGLVIGLFLGDTNWKPLSPGLPDAGPVITWIQQISKLLFTTVGLILFGQLIAITFLIKPANLRKSLGQISVFANIWAVISLIAAVTQMSYALGLDAAKTFSPGVIATYLFDLTSSRGYVISAVFALLIALLALVIKSANSKFLLVVLAGAAIITPLLNSHSASLGDHSMALTSSVVHGLAISAWVGTLFAVTPQVKAGNKEVVTNFGSLAKWSVIALAISGLAAAYTRMDSVSDLWLSGYGQLVLIKVTLFILIILLATKVRSSFAANTSVTRFLGFELSLMALAIGFGVALQNTALSRAGIELGTAAEETLGFKFPPPPSFSAYLFGWHPEWVLLTGSVIALIMYLYAVRKLVAAKNNWPIGRTISFLIGIALLAWSSSSGIAKYAMISFSAHMIQHMVLSMIAPIFLVLSAPITLALRVLPAHSDSRLQNTREWILSLIHSKYSRFITHPIAVLIIFTFGLYGLYFTPLFGDLMRSHTGHVFMEIHFLLSGFLFAFMTVGVDPAPRQIPHWGKLMMVLVALGLHTFFALAIMQSTTPVGEIWYAQVQPPWIFNLLKDTYTGGGIAWAVGEIPTLILAILVVVQWAKSDSRLANRLDRAAQRDGDSELKSYNERLAKLNQLDRD